MFDQLSGYKYWSLNMKGRKAMPEGAEVFMFSQIINQLWIFAFKFIMMFLEGYSGRVNNCEIIPHMIQIGCANHMTSPLVIQRGIQLCDHHNDL